MSIFERIKNAIWRSDVPTPAPTKPSAPASGPATPGSAAQRPPLPSTSGVGSSATATPVDIEAVLEARSKANAQKLNWRTSIVDLMKLVDLDPSFENRKALAKELGYTADTSDSATMNLWLHRQVMKKLAESGGVVPASLRE